MKNKIGSLHLLVFAALCLVPWQAQAGTTVYDMSSLLYERHPFESQAPLKPVVAAPIPSSQIYAPARIPQAATPNRAIFRSAAQSTAFERVPPQTSQSLSIAALPPVQEGLWGVISEIRVGALSHGIGPFASDEESGIDGNIEFLFNSPDFLEMVWSPRPHIGFSVNSDGDTSQAYLGLSWEWTIWKNLFVGFSLGGSIHDGKLKTNRTDRNELGCRILFRESLELGYRFLGRHSISAMLDHISNANLCDKNEGLDNFGIRYGYLF